MKPYVSILMVTSVDGRLHPSRFTSSPDGTRRDWSTEYERVQASKMRMQFKSADALNHGVVQLRYAVLPGET